MCAAPIFIASHKITVRFPTQEKDTVMAAQTFEDAGKYGKEYFDNSLKSFAAFQKGAQAIAVEATDYTKKSFEAGSAVLEKLLAVKSLRRRSRFRLIMRSRPMRASFLRQPRSANSTPISPRKLTGPSRRLSPRQNNSTNLGYDPLGSGATPGRESRGRVFSCALAPDGSQFATARLNFSRLPVACEKTGLKILRNRPTLVAGQGSSRRFCVTCEG